jgi:hypothetical protein
MKIYVASSWRNDMQPLAVSYLRANGFKVYDFRNPLPEDKGFHWSSIDIAWQNWTVEQYIKALQHPIAVDGFGKDWSAMLNSDACLLVMPCGRSAHLEAGYFVGAKKPLVILTQKCEPELMYKMANAIVCDLDSAISELRAIKKNIK